MASKEPVVSVVVPCYNCKDTLPILVESLLQQSMADFEVILVDDWSADSTWEAMNEMAQKDARLRCMHSSESGENIGPGPARTKGMYAARGKYVMFADNDDVVKPNWIRAMYSAAREKKADLVTCSFNENREGKLVEPYSFEAQESEGGWKAVRLLLETKTTSHPWLNLIAKELVERHKLFFPPTASEDMFFKLTALYHCNRFVQLPATLYTWNVRHDSTCHDEKNHTEKWSHIKSLTELPGILQDWLDSIKETGGEVPPAEEKAVYDFFMSCLLEEFMLRYRKNPAAVYGLFEKYCRENLGDKGIYMRVVVDQYIRLSEECEKYKEYRENVRHPYRMIKKMLRKKH